MNHLFGILLSPQQEWEKIRAGAGSVVGHYLKYLLWMAMLAPDRLVLWFDSDWLAGRRAGHQTHR